MIAYFGHCVHVCVLKGLGPIAQYFIACKRPKLTRIAQILVAAGKGARIGGDIPKQYRLISGKAVLQRTLETTLSEPRITETVVVVADGDPYIAGLISGLDNIRIVTGGATRTASVKSGLAALADNPPDLVLIHDGARPFVSPYVIEGVIEALTNTPAAVPSLPIPDALKSLDGKSVDRNQLRRVQTPQGFHFDNCLLYTSPSPRDGLLSRMPSSA